MKEYALGATIAKDIILEYRAVDSCNHREDIMKNSMFCHSSVNTLWSFSRALVKSPLSMGMLCPSSPYLTQQLANQIDNNIIYTLQEQVLAEKYTYSKTRQPQGYIFELGAGTGTVTKALLNRGIPTSRLIVFETCPIQCTLLRKNFPQLQIIQDDAAYMKKYLPENAYVASIVSSLPFISLPHSVSNKIIAAIKSLLGKNSLIQYTYSLNQKTLLEKNGFVVHNKHTVWFNLPPARVLSYSIP